MNPFPLPGWALTWCLAVSVACASDAGPLRIPVTTTADRGAGSLREALEALNAQGDGEIDLGSVEGEILLETALPTVLRSVRLLGPSSGRLTVNGQARTPLLAFGEGTTSTVTRLILTNALATGYRHGAAISNAGSLVLLGCELSGNRNVHGWGGAIFNRGNLSLLECALRTNVVVGEAGGASGFSEDGREFGPGGGGAGFGGAIFHESGRLYASNTVFLQNRTVGGAGGSNQEELRGTGRGGGPSGGYPPTNRVMGVAGGFGSGGGGDWQQFDSGRGVGGFGGGHSSSALLGDPERQFGGGLPSSGYDSGAGGGAAMGGAVFALAGEVALVRCRLEGNRVVGGLGGGGRIGAGEGGSGLGGALFSRQASVSMERCRILDNLAEGGRGKGPTDFSFGEFSSSGGAAEGGGVFVFSGDALMRVCTVVSNVASGGVGGSAKNGGGGGVARGGAVGIRSGTAAIERSLLWGNQALGGSPGGGIRFAGVAGNGEGGAVIAKGGALRIEHSTVHGNVAAGNDAYAPDNGFEGGWVGASMGGGIALASITEGFRYEQFSGFDFVDASSFLVRIRTAADPVSTYLRDRLRDDEQAFGPVDWAVSAFNDWSGEPPAPPSVLDGLTWIMTKILFPDPDTPPLWSESRFAGVSLRPETRELAAANLPFTDLKRFHRLLLEDAYPTELVRIPAIVQTQPALRLGYSTVTENRAVRASLRHFMFPPEAKGRVNGGGLLNTGGLLELEGVICAGNLSATNADIGGSFTSLLRNLILDPGNAVGATSQDLVGVDPKLGPLADNGGPTWTQALLTGSRAIDALRLVNGPRIDQRGVVRPLGVGTDLGAFEVVPRGTEGPRISRVTVGPDKAVRMQVSQLLMSPCQLEFSQDLETWVPVRVLYEGDVVVQPADLPNAYFRVHCGESE